MRGCEIDQPLYIHYKANANRLQAQPWIEGEMKVKTWNICPILQKSDEKLTNPNYNEDK